MSKNPDVKSYYARQNTIYESRLQKCLKTDFLALLEILVEAQGTIWLIGNGGSLAVARHAALDLTKAAHKRAFVIGDAETISAYSNDISFEDGNASYLRNISAKDDILIALSTSGESRNILSAVQVANGHGLLTVGLTSKGSSLCGMVVVPIAFEEKDPKVLEDAFQITFHKLTTMLKDIK